MHNAIERNNLSEVKELIRNGASTNARDMNGSKPIHLAAKFGHNNIIEFLLGKKVSIDDVNNNDWTPLHFAAKYGQLDTVRFLVDKGANIDARDSMRDHENVIEFFLSKKVIINDTKVVYVRWRASSFRLAVLSLFSK